MAAFALADASARFGWAVVLRGGYQVHLAMILLPTIGAAGLVGLGLARSRWGAAGRRRGLRRHARGLAGVTMLAIIDVPQGAVGRGSAWVFHRFYAGFVIGALLAGWLVEQVDY